jgi:3-deoxy-D-manno-octulosonic-acid transferase
MMWIIYNIGIYFYFILLSPFFLFSLFTREKYRAGLLSRLGFYHAALKEKCAGKKVLWFHAVSVGEVLAVLPLIDAVRIALPDHTVLLSTTTMASNRLAAERAAEKGVELIYFPLDFPWAVRRLIDAAGPRLIILTETELWPNFLRCAARKDIPMVLVNGRISPRSFKSYRRIRSFFCDFTRGIQIFGMQSELYRDNIKALGISDSRIVISGNIKYEALGHGQAAPADAGVLKAALGIPAGSRVLFGGSTHPGEEAILIDLFLSLRKKNGDLSLFIAPRHIERAPAVVQLAREKGLRASVKTGLTAGTADGREVIVLDTIGELSKLYAVGDIVFVGKSMTASGGQNILEPARLGKAVLFGPHMENFQDEARALLSSGGAAQVRDGQELERVCAGLLADPARAREMGEKGARTVEAYREGVLSRNVSLITEAVKRYGTH